MRARLLVLVAMPWLATCTDLSIFECKPPSLLVSDDTAAGGLTARPGVLSVASDVPHAASECLATLGDVARCADRDDDGMTDAWESDALRRLRPLVRYDRDEPLFCDRGAVVTMVGRVVPAPEPDHYRAFIAILYTYDYGRCSVEAHRGDVERVVLDLRAVSATEMVIAGVYTAAHEYTALDGGRLVTGDEVDRSVELVHTAAGSTRWAVYQSSAKHATYLDQELCAAHESLICAREACSPEAGDGHELLLPILNAGEPDAPLGVADDPAYDGFALDAIAADPWTTTPFCPEHGADRTACGPGAIRDKLLRDPFVEGQPEL